MAETKRRPKSNKGSGAGTTLTAGALNRMQRAADRVTHFSAGGPGSKSTTASVGGTALPPHVAAAMEQSNAQLQATQAHMASFGKQVEDGLSATQARAHAAAATLPHYTSSKD